MKVAARKEKQVATGGAAPEPKSADEEEEKSAEEEKPTVAGLPPKGQRFRVTSRAVLRNGASMQSESPGSLEEGHVIECLESQQLDDGRVRVHCQEGWLSYRTGSGKVVLEKVDKWLPLGAGAAKPAKPKPALSAGGLRGRAGRRASVAIGGGAAASASFMQPQQHGGGTLYSAKQGRTKVKLQVGQMGLQVFSSRDEKRLETHMFQFLESWNEVPDVGIEIRYRDGKKNIVYTTTDTVEICNKMTEQAMELAKMQREMKKAKQAAAASGKAGGGASAEFAAARVEAEQKDKEAKEAEQASMMQEAAEAAERSRKNKERRRREMQEAALQEQEEALATAELPDLDEEESEESESESESEDAAQGGDDGGAAAALAAAVQVGCSTRILGRRTAPFPPFLIPKRVPHGFTPRS